MKFESLLQIEVKVRKGNPDSFWRSCYATRMHVSYSLVNWRWAESSMKRRLLHAVLQGYRRFKARDHEHTM